MIPLPPADVSVPTKRDAVGWRVAVYWRQDKSLYDGNIVSFDNSTGKHEIEYDDGEREWRSLHGEKIVWRLPPGLQAESPASSDVDDSSDEGGVSEEEKPAVQPQPPPAKRRRSGSRSTQVRVAGRRSRSRNRVHCRCAI